MTKQPKPRLRIRTLRVDDHWRAEEEAAWEAVRGLWAGQALEDPLAYQRRIRRDRKLVR